MYYMDGSRGETGVLDPTENHKVLCFLRNIGTVPSRCNQIFIKGGSYGPLWNTLTSVLDPPVTGYFGEMWRPRWNAVWCGISSGYSLIAKVETILRDRNTSFYRNFDRQPLKIHNWQCQRYSGLNLRVCTKKLILISRPKHMLWYSKEPPQWDGSLEHPNIC